MDENPTIVRVARRVDVLWNRPVFQAPPLILHPTPEGTGWCVDDWSQPEIDPAFRGVAG